MQEAPINLSQLESHLWESANILRGPVDAADFKTYIFPLLFFKRICDVWDEEYAEIVDETGDAELALFPESHRFQIPDDCHWNDVRAVATNVGNALQRAMREIEKADSRDKLRQLLAQDVRKIIITTIFKFGEADGVLNDRGNIIALVDEAHRTQEGDLGRKMRDALPNAFLFGLTGILINRFDRNTFYAFGAEEDDKGYLSRYGFEESIRDDTTLKLHFEPRLLELHIDKAAIDAAFKEMTGGLSDLDRDNLGKTAAKMAVLVKTPERIRRVCEDIVQHFQSKVEPNGFKGQIVTFDRESCLLYKQELDKLLPPAASDIVMTVNANEPQYKAYARTRDEEERLLDRFRDPNDPLKLIIVTSKLLTGFDAPILQAMYLKEGGDEAKAR